MRVIGCLACFMTALDALGRALGYDSTWPLPYEMGAWVFALFTVMWVWLALVFAFNWWPEE